MIFPDYMIREYCERASVPFVTPYRPEMVQPASIDLCLGNEFIVFDSHRQRFIDLADPQDDSGKKVTIEFPDTFTLHPGEFVLGVTEERVHIPNDVLARLEGKSTIGRTGVLIHVTAGFVDPGFRGQLTLEIYNVRKVPIILHPGLPFCQLSLAGLFGPAEHPYNGRYQDAPGVEASKTGEK